MAAEERGGQPGRLDAGHARRDVARPGRSGLGGQGAPHRRQQLFSTTPRASLGTLSDQASGPPGGAAPFEYAEEFYTNLNAPSKMLLSYSEGLSNGGVCGPLNHHGFEGIGENVAGEITNWIRDKVKIE